MTAFLEAYGAAPPDDPDAVRAALDRALARAQAAWPQISVDPPAFARALAERLDREVGLVAALENIAAEDLYLVIACERGFPVALEQLETRYLKPIEAQLRTSSAIRAQLDEARQILRVRLLVSDGQRPPRIAGYRGQGPLLAWLRLSFTRVALDLLAGSKRDLALDDDGNVAMLAGVASDPETALLANRYRSDLNAAITQAFGALQAELRTILRMHFLDGVSAHDIGKVFQVSGRTIQRRINEARDFVVQQTRVFLHQRAGIHERELETLMRHLQSGLNISLRRVLASEPGTDGS